MNKMKYLLLTLCLILPSCAYSIVPTQQIQALSDLKVELEADNEATKDRMANYKAAGNTAALTEADHSIGVNKAVGGIVGQVVGAILNSYHDTDKPIIIDKARSWIHSISMLEAALGYKAKILVPVRDVAQCAASFQLLHRKNAHINNVPGEFITSQTTQGRVTHWTSASGQIGIAYNRIKQALHQGFGDRLMFVQYSHLTTNPEKTMDEVWDFLEIKSPKHDFNNIKQYTNEEDNVYGYIGMHNVISRIIPNKSKANQILGVKMARSFDNSQFWRGI